MSVTLDGIVLNDNLQLRGVEDMALVGVCVTRTIMGKTIITHAPAPAGHSLELTADQDDTRLRGVFLNFEIASMIDIRDNVETVALEHPRGNFNVKITAITVEPVFDVNDPDSDWWFLGSIQLLTV